MERKALLVSVASSLIIGVCGVTLAHLSKSEAILLDGLFNLTYFVTGIFTLRVAKMLYQPDNERFPYGYAYFEPLINGVKGALVLGVTAAAAIGAVRALASGGRPVEAGPAVIYGILAATAGFAVCGFLFQITHKHHSPILKADAKNWLLNGIISFAVLLAFIGVWIIKDTGYRSLVPYVDPVVVLMVVAVSIAIPAREAWTALMQLLNRAPSPEIVENIETMVQQAMQGLDLPPHDTVIRVLAPGRMRLVMIHIILPADFTAPIKQLDAIREHITQPLCQDYRLTLVDTVFTADDDHAGPWTPGEPS